MIVDTSALVAIVLRGEGHDAIAQRLLDPTVTAGIGTPTAAELGLVLSSRLNVDARSIVAEPLDRFELVEIPFGHEHWRVAVDAFQRFGRGRHPAGLNFGDCLTYAVAWLADEPLLFAGDGFAATDVRVA